jgi:hypothetical protein
VRGLGKGLFAVVDIRVNCIIGEFQGDRLTLRQLDRRYPGDQVAPYGLKTSFEAGEYAYDVRETTCNLARYANDARGLYRVGSRGRTVKVRNNAKLSYPSREGGPPTLVSLRAIKAGEEILAAYGDEYWA